MPISLIGKLLGFTGLPQWALELLAVGAIAGGIGYWHHSTLERGIAEGVAKRDAYYQPLLQAAQASVTKDRGTSCPRHPDCHGSRC
jgi:hypothetical protein